jgi:uncharacterized protein (DUF2141 family)
LHFIHFHCKLKFHEALMELFFSMKRSLYIILFLVLLFTGCAKMAFPPGGPEDKTPPKIVSAIPTPGETRVDPDTPVQVFFSESIQPQSVAGAVFISPYPGENVRYRIRGKKITVLFTEPLQKEKTYVLTFGTGIKDYRNNSMKATYSLAFSTGDSLDAGKISGRVFGRDDATGIDIWAYTSTGIPDHDPSIRLPDYIVQCEADGAFHFQYLSAGKYRLFAVQDRAADRLYQKVEDGIGVTHRDAEIERNGMLHVDSLFFRMTVEDTLGPSLVKAESRDHRLLVLQFDEDLGALPVPDQFNIVSAEDSADTLTVEQVFYYGTKHSILHLITRDQEAKQYRIIVGALSDAAGNAADPAHGDIRFAGSAQSDTTSPSLIRAAPAPNSRSVPLDGRILLMFDEAMDTVAFPEGFDFSDTLNNTIDGTIRWHSPMEMVYQTAVPPESMKDYRVSLHADGVRDVAGNSLADSLYQYQTLNGDTLTELAGVVVDPDSSGMGAIHVTVRQTGNPKIFHTLKLNQPGDFRFSGMLPGRYLMDCFRDRDGNDRYSYGQTFPFIPAERFTVYPDTIVLRSRWFNEGNNIILP